MSWQERLDNVRFTIITGDGKSFTPLWKNGSKEKSFNYSNYNFIDVEGGFTDRKKPQASKYPLVFWFQGDDNIEQADAFESSANDSRPWQIKHPFYGNIIGQPISLNRNDSSYNITEITVEFWESISADYPNPLPAVDDLINSKVEELSDEAAKSYDDDIEPTAEDTQTLQDSIIQISASFNKLFDNETFSDYKTLMAKTQNDVNNLISSPLQAITSLHSLVLTPALFMQSVKSRLSALKESFAKITDILDRKSSLNNKLYFESQSAVIVAAICQSASTPIDTDYTTRNEIEDVNNLILEVYNSYLQLLDNSQISVSDIKNSYHPNPLVQTKLHELVTETTGNLFSLAFQAKQERTVEVDRDTNLILLTHKYIGLDTDDKNIEMFRQINSIKNDELFLIKKGRTIKYFV